MTRFGRIRALVGAAFLACTLSGLPTPAGAAVLQTQTPEQRAKPGQEEFVPIDQLPPEEQMPAAPLLIAAYGFVWMALLGYLWTIWRRLGRVERELADVRRRTAATERRT